jgi:mannose-6-phosphate isomerase-like protein (cupin superfamily)
MDVANVRRAGGKFFRVLQTGKRSQTAVMALKPGEESGPKANEHPRSEQVLLVLEGEVRAEVGRARRRTLKAGDAVVVPPGTRHRFVNKGKRTARTLNFYAPPAYDPDESG